jgi:hypothetical protein
MALSVIPAEPPRAGRTGFAVDLSGWLLAIVQWLLSSDCRWTSK